MRKIVSAVVAIVLIASPVLGATISLDQISQPGGAGTPLIEDGKFSVVQGTETLQYVRGAAQLAGTQQITFSQGTTTGENWSCSLSLYPGTYDCWGILYYIDGAGTPRTLPSSSIRGTVR